MGDAYDDMEAMGGIPGANTQRIVEVPEEQQIQEIANIPVAFIHFGIGETVITTAMPQIPGVGESVHFDDPNIPIGNVFSVRWCYNKDSSHWHAEVSIR